MRRLILIAIPVLIAIGIFVAVSAARMSAKAEDQQQEQAKADNPSVPNELPKCDSESAKDEVIKENDKAGDARMLEVYDIKEIHHDADSIKCAAHAMVNDETTIVYSFKKVHDKYIVLTLNSLPGMPLSAITPDETIVSVAPDADGNIAPKPPLKDGDTFYASIQFGSNGLPACDSLRAEEWLRTMFDQRHKGRLLGALELIKELYQDNDTTECAARWYITYTDSNYGPSAVTVTYSFKRNGNKIGGSIELSSKDIFQYKPGERINSADTAIAPNNSPVVAAAPPVSLPPQAQQTPEEAATMQEAERVAARLTPEETAAMQEAEGLIQSKCLKGKSKEDIAPNQAMEYEKCVLAISEPVLLSIVHNSELVKKQVAEAVSDAEEYSKGNISMKEWKKRSTERSIRILQEKP